MAIIKDVTNMTEVKMEIKRPRIGNARLLYAENRTRKITAIMAASDNALNLVIR